MKASTSQTRNNKSTILIILNFAAVRGRWHRCRIKIKFAFLWHRWRKGCFTCKMLWSEVYLQPFHRPDEEINYLKFIFRGGPPSVCGARNNKFAIRSHYFDRGTLIIIAFPATGSAKMTRPLHTQYKEVRISPFLLAWEVEAQCFVSLCIEYAYIRWNINH